LLKQEKLEDQDLADATSMLAQAYFNTKSVDSAITQLEIASNATKSNDERGRYRFIQGQLYNILGKKDSANIAFDNVIDLNRRTPRIYMITAYLEKIKNFDFKNGDKTEALELFKKLEENRENRPFLDKIYHQIGDFHLTNASDSLAVSYYNRSLRTNSKDKILESKNYETLGDMYFDNSEYARAGAYFDSTMNSLTLNSKPYRIIKRKRDNLEDVIYYEAIAKTNDSILHLINLPTPERLALFESFISDLKIRDKKEKEEAETAERNASVGLVTNNNFPGATNNTGAKGGLPNQAALFYFYNPTTVAYGKNEFIKIWGNRELQDNWRWSSKSGGITNNNTTDTNNVLALASDEEKFDPQFYISKIPTDPKEIDSISRQRNYAYYQLGLIYKEKFKEYQLSKSKFLDLLKSSPEERLILPSKYNLYKIYELLGENGEAAIAKNEIIKNYPESRYATILEHPELVSNKDLNSPESLYEDLYKLHEQQNYAQVISKSETYIKRFDGEPIVPKLELLKAIANGRLNGFEAYKKGINHLSVTYANTTEGKQAQKLINEVLPKIENSNFTTPPDSITTNYKVIFQFKNLERENIPTFKKTLDSVLKDIKYYKLASSVDVYSPNNTFVLVHGIKNETVAKTFTQLLTDENKKKIIKPFFVISSANYQIVQIHKNLESYLALNNQ